MGHRLSKIYTRTGDTGTTGLGDGSRIKKDHLRIVVLGEIDELNSSIGVILSEQLPPIVHTLLTNIQHDLFDLGGEMAVPNATFLSATQVTHLEQTMDEFNLTLGPLKEFILPGGTRSAAAAFLARAICRRAERAMVSLANEATVSEVGRQYLNRLSDLLFVLGRVLNHAEGRGDVLWQKGKNQ